MISVAVCTRNRAHLLKNTLVSLNRMEKASELAWELLIIDNASTDDTRAIAGDFSSTLPLRYIVEPVPGLSRARNRAVREFKGDYLVWTDDDVRVERDWLLAYSEAFRKRPHAAVFGGPIRPEFEASPPAWLVEMLPEVASAYAVRDIFAGARELSLPGPVPLGANYAIHGDMQREYLYDVELGFSPSRPNLRGEETQVIRSILESGHTGWWVPEAGVRHWIPRERQTVKYLWLYYFGEGQRRALGGYDREHPLILGRPRWLWRQIVERPLRLGFAVIRGDRKQIGRELRRSAVSWGMLLEVP